jgi:hypothetical protein
MKDIHEVLRRKQAKYAQLGKQIEALQGAAEKLRMIAPLLADEDDDLKDVVLSESEEETSQPAAMAARATTAPPAQPAASVKRGVAPRWP